MKKLLLTLIAAALLMPCLGQAAPQQSPYPPAPTAGSKVTVEDTVYGVLRTHRAIRSSQENREALTHELERAKRGFGPRVDVSAAGGLGYLSDSTTRANDWDNAFYGQVKLSAQLVQPIWDGFATRSRVRNAQASLEGMTHRVFDNATSLSLDGIIAHINLLRSRELVRLAEENVQVHERILSMATDRAAIGADTQADASQAHSRHQRALSSLEEQRDALRVAEDTYTRLTGIPASMALATVPMPPETFKDPSQVFAQCEKDNPKLRAYMRDIRAARANRELSEAAFYPVFNLETGPNYTDRGGDWDNLDRWTYSFDILLTMRWNIFNSGADLAAYKASDARIRQARQLYYDLIDTLKLDIDKTWSNYLAAQAQYKHYTKAMEYNSYTLNAYNEQFQIGRRTLLDVLDSENELYNSSSQAETARSNIVIGAYRLAALTGNLLPRMSIKTEGLYQKPAEDPEDRREVFEKGWFN